jgi:catalase
MVIAQKVGGVAMNDGSFVSVDGQLAGTPSCLLDAVVLLLPREAGITLAKEAAAVDFVRDAYGHLKAIGVSDGARPLVQKAGIDSDGGVIDPFAINEFIEAAKTRQWARECNVRTLP